MDTIKQTKYNKINCTGCGEYTEADLVAFNFSKVFAEAIQESEEDTVWESLVYLDLRFYYTVRDICQELKFRTERNKYSGLVLTVKNVVRQIEFLMNDTPFDLIKKETRNSVLYNSLYETISSTYGSAEEKMAEIETLIRNLASSRDDDVIVRVPVKISLNEDEDGNEMADKLSYCINGEERILSERVCPQCGTPMDWLAGYRNEFIIGMAGLSRVGKTAYIAALIHQLKKLDNQGFIHIKENESESLAKFEREVVSEFEKGNIIYKTEVENVDMIPLVYIPLQIGGREYNFIFVDMPGEIYSGTDSGGLDFISNKRSILKNADVIWCCIEPSMIDSKYGNANVAAKKEDASKQLSGLVSILNMVYNIKIPASIIVTQCDLLKADYPLLFRPDIDVMEEYMLENNSLDFVKMKDYVNETRTFVDRMHNFRLSIEDTFEGITMFGVASYGFDVSDKVLLSNKRIQPSMVELPFLWTLAKLNLIDVTKVSSVKTLLGKEKSKYEALENPKELYVQR